MQNTFRRRQGACLLQMTRTLLGWLLSPTLFNIFFSKDALEEHDEKNSIGDGTITDLRFADDINAVAGEKQAVEALDESIDRICSRYKMEISAEKTKLTSNISSGIQRKNKAKGQKLGIDTSFKYSFKWRDINISLGSKVKLVCHIFLSP